MNQRDWVEYFEAINGRKPTMQEFQEAREKGEFVMEQKDVPAPTPVTPAPASQEQAPTQEVAVAPSAPFSQESTAFVPPQPSAKTLQPVQGQKRPKLSFNKPTKFGLAVVAIVTVISLVWIFFFTGTQSLDGIWLSNTDSFPIVYELNGKNKSVNGNYTIKEVINGDEAKQEFNDKVSQLNSSNLQTLSDVDKKFNLKTKEVIIVKYDSDVTYNLLQENGTCIILKNDLDNLVKYKSNSSGFKEFSHFRIEMPKALVGKWKVIKEDNHEIHTINISDHGIMSRGPSKVAVGYYSISDISILEGKSSKSNDRIQQQFLNLQERVESLGYQLKSAKEVYKQTGIDFYSVLVNGGKTILIFDEEFKLVSRLEKVH